MNPNDEQVRVRCVLMRAGTSKGLFFHAADLPPAGAGRDRLLKRAMGTPDVMQIDGLGGSRLVTSKVAIIQRSERADADVDYTFAQVDIALDRIDHEGNCGNISSGVGLFAIDEGLVAAVAPITTVRIYNTNTDKVLVARVPVSGGRARVGGDCVIAGVPGSGAEILLDYAGSVGARTGRLLPTGEAVGSITLDDGLTVRATICDAANPTVFVPARDLGFTGTELPAEIMANGAALRRIGEIQCRAAQLIGLVDDWRTLSLPAIPLFVMVAAPMDYTDMNGDLQSASGMDLLARLVFLGQCHESMAGTGSMATAAASRVPGSIVNEVLPPGRAATRSLRIGHPLGIMTVTVEAEGTDAHGAPRLTALGMSRTARRLMDGTLYLPQLDLE